MAVITLKVNLNNKRNTHKVYQADLENAIRFAIFHEIPSKAKISGASLLALQKFLNTLSRYHPLTENGQRFLDCVKTFASTSSQTIPGEDLQHEIQKVEKEYSSLFSHNKVYEDLLVASGNYSILWLSLLLTILIQQMHPTF